MRKPQLETNNYGCLDGHLLQLTLSTRTQNTKLCHNTCMPRDNTNHKYCDYIHLIGCSPIKPNYKRATPEQNQHTSTRHQVQIRLRDFQSHSKYHD